MRVAANIARAANSDSKLTVELLLFVIEVREAGRYRFVVPAIYELRVLDQSRAA
jgi:hypothetical protein